MCSPRHRPRPQHMHPSHLVQAVSSYSCSPSCLYLSPPLCQRSAPIKYVHGLAEKSPFGAASQDMVREEGGGWEGGGGRRRGEGNSIANSLALHVVWHVVCLLLA